MTTAARLAVGVYGAGGGGGVRGKGADGAVERKRLGLI